MEERDWLAQRFEEHRARLRAVAYRMLGSLSEADDAVQEAWLRLSRTETGEIENLGGWLTTVVARVSGARAVAGQALFYSRLGLITRPALVNGAVGTISTRDDELFSVGGVTVRGGKIVEMDILADPARLRDLDLTILDD
jgi:hypothetical protein